MIRLKPVLQDCYWPKGQSAPNQYFGPVRAACRNHFKLRRVHESPKGTARAEPSEGNGILREVGRSVLGTLRASKVRPELNPGVDDRRVHSGFARPFCGDLGRFASIRKHMTTVNSGILGPADQRLAPSNAPQRASSCLLKPSPDGLRDARRAVTLA